ncbi:MAG: hypothetical protein OXU36_12880 [Candidatus Poribacteria bacterium]|nr:hypothetical protein [Candidatus Poribacteria bacterium]
MNKLVFSILLLLISGVVGCAILQESAPVEISASRLTCKKNPEMVDGDLETIGIFETDGTIQKGPGRRGQYQRRVEGSLRTETLIKLDAPTYIAYVEVYPASTIPRFSLDITVEEKLSNRPLTFEPVKDKRGEKAEGEQPIRFQIGRNILYLRLTAYALEDPENVGVYNEANIRKMEAALKSGEASPEAIKRLQQQWERQKRRGAMQIDLKGAAIREVKFYGREPS